MRIVAGRASRLLIDDMKSMAPILSPRIDRAKALIPQNAASIVALITERVTADTFERAVRQEKLAFKNRRVNRTVRPIRTSAAGFRPLIIVVAIRAVNAAPGCQRREQTRNIWIFAHRFDRVIRNIRGIKLETLVCLDNLAIHMRWAAPNTVRMAPETKLVFRINCSHNHPGGRLALHTR